MLKVLEVANMEDSIKNIESVPTFGDFLVNSNTEDLFFFSREREEEHLYATIPFKAKNILGFSLRYVGIIRFFFHVRQYYQLDSHKKSCLALANLQPSINQN